jgi:hypothetical protein
LKENGQVLAVQFTVDVVTTQFRGGKLRDAENFNFDRVGDITG